MSDSGPSPEERIVVGVDGSEASIDALHWAARQATLTGAELRVVIAWHFPVVSGDSPISTMPDWRTDALIAIDSLVKHAQLPAALRTSREVIEGHPAQVLTQAAVGADLLVVGSRGHGGFRGMLLGSVSDYVCTHAPCPVVVVRHIDHG